MEFNGILKKLRQDNEMTQEELAKKINSSRSNIANYENGKNMPSVEVLEKLAKVFDCTLDYLMGKSEIRNPEQIKTEDIDLAFASGIKGLNKENQEIAKNIIEGLLAKQKNEENKEAK